MSCLQYNIQFITTLLGLILFFVVVSPCRPSHSTCERDCARWNTDVRRSRYGVIYGQAAWSLRVRCERFI